MTSDVESACIQHGKRGFLEHEHIENMIAQLSEEEKEARVYGRPQHYVGRVFKMFDRKIHVIDPFHLNVEDYCIYEALDPHPRNPDAVNWLAVDKYGQKFIVDELYLDCNSTEELATRIKNKSSQYRLINRVIDPSAFNLDKHNGAQDSLSDKLQKYGLKYIPASKRRSEATIRIRDSLVYRKDLNGNFLQTPELYIFSTCERTIWEIENWRWDENQGKTADKKDRKEKPIDKDDHCIENVGRLLLLEPKFTFYQPININYAPRRSGYEQYDPY